MLRYVSRLPVGPVHYRFITTSWGTAGIVCRGQILLRLYLPYEQVNKLSDDIRSTYPQAHPHERLLPSLASAVERYFSGEPVCFEVTVDASWASPFGRKVLAACAKIPPGRTVSYGELAAQAGHPRAARAVGRVLAANRAPLVIPCHRVVRADGSPGGFSATGGVSFKRRLLRHEAKMFPQENMHKQKSQKHTDRLE